MPLISFNLIPLYFPRNTAIPLGTPFLVATIIPSSKTFFALASLAPPADIDTITFGVYSKLAPLL